MSSKSGNANMSKAKSAKNDEFYTQLTDIEKEVKHYRDHFKNKVVFLNCDDPEYSNFWKYFAMNFERLGIKRLVSTHYANGKDTTYMMTIDHSIPESMELNEFNYPKGITTDLTGDGDFRSDECIEILKSADIVCTNPPFSLFREYVAQLMEYEKDFLIIGNQNAITYKETFPLLKDNSMFLGVHSNKVMWFQVPSSYPMIGSRVKEVDGSKFISVPAISWFTNMAYPKRYEDQLLFRKYKGHESDYPKYDNYDAIEVSRVKDIPADYDGAMGVPITFLNNHNPDQFEILGMIKGSDAFGVKRQKIYINPIQHSTGLTAKPDNNVNAAPAIKVRDVSGFKKYYTADNSDGYLISKYARIVIRRR